MKKVYTQNLKQHYFSLDAEFTMLVCAFVYVRVQILTPSFFPLAVSGSTANIQNCFE